MKFAQWWQSALLVGFLTIGAGRTEEPASNPSPPADAPAPLKQEIIQQAEPLPPVSKRIFDQHVQTINWLARPKAATSPPTKPPSERADIVTTGGQVPSELPPPTAQPPVTPLPSDLFNYEIAPGWRIEFDGAFRGYYRNDQRIYWSGLETTFGGEGIFRPLLQAESGCWIVSAQGEFFINQKYGTSILSDAQRDLYRTNFQIDPFEVFQLFGQMQYGDWMLRAGKSRTPFGNYESPAFTNSLIDAPFIRTEVIPWTETGLFIHGNPGPWSFDLALTNGEPNLDTNSSKAGIARIGYSGDFWTIGTSIKRQDGISSEFQKRYNNIYGFDYSLRFGHVVAYGEATYDEYGFRRNFDLLGNPLNLGIRSLYHRDVYSGRDFTPVHGLGYYVGLGYRGARWLWDATYGTYFPERLGIPPHDANIQRAVVKGAFAVTPNFQLYTVGIVENVRPRDGVLLNNHPYAILAGVQLTF